MNVKELIEKLEKMDPSTVVLLEDGKRCQIKDVYKMGIIRNDKSLWGYIDDSKPFQDVVIIQS